jgi:hypothetical protein
MKGTYPMQTISTILAIIASLLTIYNVYINRKNERKIKELTEILIENENNTSLINKGNFNKQASSGDHGVSIIGKGNSITKGRDQ